MLVAYVLKIQTHVSLYDALPFLIVDKMDVVKSQDSLWRLERFLTLNKVLVSSEVNSQLLKTQGTTDQHLTRRNCSESTDLRTATHLRVQWGWPDIYKSAKLKPPHSVLTSRDTQWRFLMFEISRKISAENSSVIINGLIDNKSTWQFGISKIYFGYIFKKHSSNSVSPHLSTNPWLIFTILIGVCK